MNEGEDVDRYSYLVRTRPGRDEYVVSTIRKYYEELLVDVVTEHDGRENCLVVTAVTDLPTEAFERISEVETVERIPSEAE